jgi:UDP-glucose-4-epimerase GalE
MTLLLGHRSDAIHEIEGLLEVRELEVAMKVVFLRDRPLRDALVYFLQVVSLEWCDAATARDAFLVGKLFSHGVTSQNRKLDLNSRIAACGARAIQISDIQSSNFDAKSYVGLLAHDGAGRIILFALRKAYLSNESPGARGSKGYDVVVLVIGGAGYIGSHAARALRRAGHEVIIFDNLSTGHECLAAGFELVKGDILDRSALARVLPRADAIMHFAALAYVGESVTSPRKYFHNNVEGGLSLLNAALEAGVKKVIFSSTCAVYGEPEKIPIEENIPRQPVNPYGVTKLFFEQALEAYDRAYGFRFASLRYFNAAGADESGEIGELHDPETHLIPLALQAVAGLGPELSVFGSDYPTPDGTCVRDYIHVNDLASAHLKALEHLAAGKESFAVNVGTGTGASIKEVLSAVEEVTGKRVPHKMVLRRAGDPPVLVANPAKAQALLQWKATRGLRDVVATASNWMGRRKAVR